MGQLAVVGEQQQPLGVDVEAADGEHPRLGRHEVDDGGPALGVAGRRDDAGRLVQQVVDEVGVGGHQGAVDLEHVAADVDPRADVGDLAVDA